MKTKIFFVGVFGLIITIVSVPKQVHACSCAAFGSTEEAYEAADAVFVGEVSNFEARGNGIENRDIEFSITKVFKGGTDAEQTLQTPSDSAACGYEFTKGEKYLVFANRWGDETVGPLTVSLCSMTQLESEADDELVDLEDLTTPTIPEDPQDSGVIRALMERLIQLLRELLAQYGR